ncbi:metallophosphoesterase [Mucilaginibacter lacusdianchii]|uniref:metallophosphoesterase n=1 Tax=Mucilaginibacter lacusdianchii TaxID=2684211 RepID=UPI00131CBA18|nr:metallophosphoesterase [Mucilaginibacter sp. JXJ CY 39]
MRRLLQKLFSKPLIRLADKYSSRPDKQRVHDALSELYQKVNNKPGDRGVVIPFQPEKDKFIILSDQHKGARDYSDDFTLSEKNYLAALDYYNQQQYHYINLGDSEELWENGLSSVIKHNRNTFDKERQFLERSAFIKIFGNHDLYWDNDPLAALNLKLIYKTNVKIYEAVVLQTNVNGAPLSIFLTHGHQGDLQSDGNWFSKWFVANVWGPVQSYLRINPNTPSSNDHLKTVHNQIMYDWSSCQHNLLLITGHTHQPVFQSLTHLERLYIDLDKANKANDQAKIEQLRKQISVLNEKGENKFNFPGYQPTYFNTGCCCFDDGDITGIEIADGYMRLIKWEYNLQGASERIILDEARLTDIAAGLTTEVNPPAKIQTVL